MCAAMSNVLRELQDMPYRVFIVEDDVELRTVLERVLRAVHSKVQIDWATSAEGAADLLENRSALSSGSPFDLIVADIFLEGVATGLDFWKLCKITFPEIPLVVTSSMSYEKFYKTIGKGAVAPPFLAKPFSVKQCRQMLERLNDYGIGAYAGNAGRHLMM